MHSTAQSGYRVLCAECGVCDALPQVLCLCCPSSQASSTRWSLFAHAGSFGGARPPRTLHKVASRAAGEGVNADEVHVVRVIRVDGKESTFTAAPSAELANAWQLTQKLLGQEEGSLEYDDYGPGFGVVASRILGEDNAADGSWFWALYAYGSFTQEWLRSPSSADTTDLDTFPHIAWVACRTAVDPREETERVTRLLGSKPLKS
ncbi:unnamed protein product [Effrenium voratum]|nr:unnamed protein product [Effrenium voratum]